MNNKGGFLINSAVLIAVLVFGIVLGWTIGSDSDELNSLMEENRQLAEQLESLQENTPEGGGSNELGQPFSCTSNSDCVLKREPYCCGESLEYAQGCFHINENPSEPTDCTGGRSCPGISPASDCSCIEGVCQ